MMQKQKEQVITTTTATSTAPAIRPTDLPASADTALRGTNGKVIINDQGIVNTKVFRTLVATGDEELVRALTANVLNAMEEGIRQAQICHKKEDLIGIAMKLVSLIPRTRALGLRNLATALTALVEFIDKATTPPAEPKVKSKSKPGEVGIPPPSMDKEEAIKKLPGTPTSRQIQYEKDLEKALELLGVVEKELKKGEDFMLRFNGEAGLKDL